MFYLLLTSGATLTESSFNDATAVVGSSYSYQVTACNQVGCGPPVTVIVN